MGVVLEANGPAQDWGTRLELVNGAGRFYRVHTAEEPTFCHTRSLFVSDSGAPEPLFKQECPALNDVKGLPVTGKP